MGTPPLPRPPEDRGEPRPRYEVERDRCLRGCRLDLFSSRMCGVCGQIGLAYGETPEAREGADDVAGGLIEDMWPFRHDYFGVRLMLRSLVKLARRQR